MSVGNTVSHYKASLVKENNLFKLCPSHCLQTTGTATKREQKSFSDVPLNVAPNQKLPCSGSSELETLNGLSGKAFKEIFF